MRSFTIQKTRRCCGKLHVWIAAGGRTPGLRIALQHRVRPDRVVTVFAGPDRDAPHVARNISRSTPSSPHLPCCGTTFFHMCTGFRSKGIRGQPIGRG